MLFQRPQIIRSKIKSEFNGRKGEIAMKNYLVSYSVGTIIKTTQIEVKDDYIPSLDMMKTIKQKVIEKDEPRWLNLYSDPDNCGGYINMVKGDKITSKELKIVAISNLDI